mmetsp:Transcript_13916/g.26717  ORF Transcript_13916/g.26717 Transcript_13916/m.26717 type:complete len:82 (-) Transcript_13916:79-324(-)
MHVNVLFFARARELVGDTDTKMELKDGANTKDLVSALVVKFPKLKDMIHKIVLAVNQEYVTGVQVLHDRDEVALIPPISGG